mgnify:CR=1 FL=1
METKKIIERANKAVTEAFNSGSKFERERLIDKACEWLESAIRPYAGYSDTADIIESFRKTMEE